MQRVVSVGTLKKAFLMHYKSRQLNCKFQKQEEISIQTRVRTQKTTAMFDSGGSVLFQFDLKLSCTISWNTVVHGNAIKHSRHVTKC